MKLFNWVKKPKTQKPKTVKPDPTIKYYKVLGKNHTSCYGGKHTWKPNKWTSKIKNIIPCIKGWHFCRLEDLPRWLNEEIWEVELHEDAEIIEENDKVVTTGPVRITKQLDWNKQKAIQFAADCAERVLPIFEDAYPEDNRPRKAIEAVREYAKDMTEENREKAADASVAAAAAYAAAAYAAADAAADADAYAAAYAAARAAADAYAAARAAAYAAADADERKWQAEKLREYLEIDDG